MQHNLTPAAVLIPLILPRKQGKGSEFFHLKTKYGCFDVPAATEVIFTLRTDKVEHHKGQISFPGGVFETQDASLQETALRESFEEIGLKSDLVEIIAELPPIPTFASRFKVNAYVGLIREKPILKPNPDEIEEILQIPLNHLLSPENSKIEHLERDGLRFQTKAFYFDMHRIWGVTGHLLHLFLEKLQMPQAH